MGAYLTDQPASKPAGPEAAPWRASAHIHGRHHIARDRPRPRPASAHGNLIQFASRAINEAPWGPSPEAPRGPFPGAGPPRIHRAIAPSPPLVAVSPTKPSGSAITTSQ
ncbi:hypothetical protein PGT21_020820 [Puccinia graminis f. sp. tritici]|uniref:Uncharacterized protein n=1 Tax=Puccinia graminis f. sp. tritici TaxID=56615 RepID=A0A5B0QAX0_PUCGR|nr:hypothetical protein PGT21_020820 [Puccinia graminis f. sp. tritici]